VTRSPATRGIAVLALAAAGLAAGCLGDLLQRPAPERHFFRLQPPAPPAVAARGSGVLRVERVRVAPSFAEQSFVYRTGESRYESDFYHAFFAPPDLALRQLLIDWLGTASLFSTVSSASRPAPDWLLDAELQQLYGDRRAAGGPRAVLELRMRLLDAHSPERELVFEKLYAVSEPAADPSADALVAAWERALGRTLGELADDLRGATAARRTGKR
jgi:uncharacterized lipoprotein YmbA